MERRLPYWHITTDEEQMRPLLAFNMIGIVLSNTDNAILQANDSFLELVGYTRKDLERGNITWEKLTPRKYNAIDERKIQELIKHGTIEPFEKEYIHKKGHLVPVVVGAARIRENPLMSACFALDISRQKEAERQKDEFAGTVSHELKTPLAVLKMQASLLRDDVLQGASRETILEALGEFDQQIDKLTILITDLLNTARLQAHTRGAHRKPFDIQACVKKIVSDFRLVTPRTIVLKKGTEKMIVAGDEARIGQVITNLLSNALRYSPSRAKVEVWVERRDKYAVICVRDYGYGIEKKDVKKIFERYYRTKRVGERPLNSAGIGLHLCKEIVKQHKGRLEVESVPGKGSTFYCSLPLAQENKTAVT